MAARGTWGSRAGGWDGSDDDDEEGSDSDGGEQIMVKGPDQDGIKTYDIYKKNDSGQRVHIIRKTRINKKPILVNKNVARRRKLPKFGDCQGQGVGTEDGITLLSGQSLLTLRPRSKDEAEKEEEKAKVDKMKAKGDGVAQCRFCGASGHFSVYCPKRKQIEPTLPVGDPSTGGGAGPGGKYVPPSRRGPGGSVRAAGAAGDAYADSTLRISNLSEDATESDVRELFSEFGPIMRMYVAKDRKTGVGRGFAFVSYPSREHANRAIEVMNGHGYDSLILRVEHAKPREDDDKPKEKREDKPEGGRGIQGWR
eukprot:g48689.t1